MRLRAVVVLFCLATSITHGAIQLDDNTNIEFASVEKGRRILATSDRYIERMSPFDRASRMRTDRDVSKDEFLRFVGKSVLPWETFERRNVESAIRLIQPRLAKLSVNFPKTLYMVKTTGDEEGGAAYTRGNAIVIPVPLISPSHTELARIISHELFHIVSTHNDELRERLYRLIGFEKCNEVELPPALAARKISNPDAPRNDHRIRVRLGRDLVWAIPIIFSNDRYDASRGGSFFDYLQFRLLLVEGTGSRVRPVYDGTGPRLVEVDQVTEFFDQVGRNTEYVVHPEEILADNFALLVLGKRDLPTPAIPNRMWELLTKANRSVRHAPMNTRKESARDAIVIARRG